MDGYEGARTWESGRFKLVVNLVSEKESKRALQAETTVRLGGHVTDTTHFLHKTPLC